LVRVIVRVTVIDVVVALTIGVDVRAILAPLWMGAAYAIGIFVIAARLDVSDGVIGDDKAIDLGDLDIRDVARHWVIGDGDPACISVADSGVA
jgi:hypothetical protein